MYFGIRAAAGGLRRGPPVRLGPGEVEVGRALVNSSKTIWREPSSWVWPLETMQIVREIDASVGNE